MSGPLTPVWMLGYVTVPSSTGSARNGRRQGLAEPVRHTRCVEVLAVPLSGRGAHLLSKLGRADELGESVTECR